MYESLLYLSPTLNVVMVNVQCQLDWVMGYPGICRNITSGCVHEGFSGGDYIQISRLAVKIAENNRTYINRPLPLTPGTELLGP